MKKMWKNRSGVSPVIATILMVAITVVLFSVVFLMATRLGEDQGKPTADLSAVSRSSDPEDKVTIASISESTLYSNLKIAIVVGNDFETQTVAESYSSSIWPTGVNSVTFIDKADDGKVDTGDYFLIDAAEGTEVTFHLMFSGDGSTIAKVTWTSM
jgi:flagellin-like protein